MKTFTITTLGCKVNQYESQQIRQLLESYGLQQTARKNCADLAIIHTCCVTHTAASKSRQAIRKIRKANPNCKIIATGCLTSANTDETANIDSDIYLVSREESLPQAIKNVLSSTAKPYSEGKESAENSISISKTANAHKIKHKKELSSEEDPLNLNILDSYKGQSRAFIKIQDGCDAFCTYCIIPKIRTNLWSNTPDKIIEEAKTLVDAGHKEIVLTGIFLGAFGQSTTIRKRWNTEKQNNFTKLVEKIALIDGLKRLRLSSLEPGDVTPELLDLFNKFDNLAPHLHLPLQAGSSRILKRMNRQYNSGEFREMIEMVKERLDRPAITTDIIVGFPGETDEDFAETLKMSEFAEFAKIHVFPFSVRKGTAAEKMDGHLKPEVIKQRVAKLSELDVSLQEKFPKQFVGEEISVIIENDKSQTGRSERYFEVKLINSDLKRGDFTKAILKDNCIEAEVI